MDDPRRRSEGYAPTLAVGTNQSIATDRTVAAPSGVLPSRVSGEAKTELAAGTATTGPPAAEPMIGGAIGRYLVVARVGSDPIGVVYAGRDEAGTAVAIKLVHAAVAHAPYRARLVRQAATLAGLTHPSLVPVEEVGVAYGRPFVVMPFVEGALLSAWLETPRPWAEIVDVFVAIGGALATAHRAGLCHGDWTTACALISTAGVPRVIDVGLGRFDPSGDGAPTPRIDQLRWAVALRGALGGGTEGDPARWAAVPEGVRTVIAGAIAAASGGAPVGLAAVLAALDAALGRGSALPTERVVAVPSSHARRAMLAAGGAVMLVGAAGIAYVVMPSHGGAATASPAAPAPAPLVTPIAEAPTAAAPDRAPDRAPGAAAADVPAQTPARPAPAVVPAAVSPAAPPVAVSPAPPPAHAPAPAHAAVPSGTDAGVAAAPASVPAPPEPDAPPPTAPPRLDATRAIRAALAARGYDHMSAALAPDLPPEVADAAGPVREGFTARIHSGCGAATPLFTAALGKLGQSTLASTWRAHLELNLGICAVLDGSYGAALPHLRIAVQLGDDREQHEGLFAQGLAEWMLGDHPTALVSLHRARTGADPGYMIEAIWPNLVEALGVPP